MIISIRNSIKCYPWYSGKFRLKSTCFNPKACRRLGPIVAIHWRSWRSVVVIGTSSIHSSPALGGYSDLITQNIRGFIISCLGSRWMRQACTRFPKHSSCPCWQVNSTPSSSSASWTSRRVYDERSVCRRRVPGYSFTRKVQYALN